MALAQSPICLQTTDDEAGIDIAHLPQGVGRQSATVIGVAVAK